MVRLIKNEDYKIYKDYPDGSPSKKMYDAANMDFNRYLEKYYAKPNLSQWNQLNRVFVENAFKMNKKEYEDYLQNSRIHTAMIFNHDKLEYNYEFIKAKQIFDDELSKFLAYLMSCDFLEEINVDFDVWLMMKDWINPGKSTYDLSILEIANFKNGENFLKQHLPEMPLFKLL